MKPATHEFASVIHPHHTAGNNLMEKHAFVRNQASLVRFLPCCILPELLLWQMLIHTSNTSKADKCDAMLL